MFLKANFFTTSSLEGFDASGLEFGNGLPKGMPFNPRASCRRRSSSPNNKNSPLFSARVTTSNSIRTTDMADELKGAGVLVTYPMLPYLIESLDQKFTIYKLWEAENREDFLARHAQSIRGVACNGKIGIDAQLIDALPCLEIVATNSVGLDKVDLKKCRQRNIAVAHTPDVVTDDVADLAIALMVDTLRHISAADRYVRQGLWPLKGDYKLTSKNWSMGWDPMVRTMVLGHSSPRLVHVQDLGELDDIVPLPPASLVVSFVLLEIVNVRAIFRMLCFHPSRGSTPLPGQADCKQSFQKTEATGPLLSNH